MLQLSPHNGIAHGLLGHELDSDHFPCADVRFARAFNVFGQPMMAEVIVEGGIGFYRTQIGPFVGFIARLFKKLANGCGFRIMVVGLRCTLRNSEQV